MNPPSRCAGFVGGSRRLGGSSAGRRALARGDRDEHADEHEDEAADAEDEELEATPAMRARPATASSTPSTMAR